MSELNVVVSQNTGIIGFNYEELKEKLVLKMSEYKGAIFTDDSIPTAKKEVASLRKLKKALNDRKIEVKNEFMNPYIDFESKVKELSELIEEPIVIINEQVADFEERRKEEKKAKIAEIYSELTEEVKEYLPLTKIYDAKWENTGTSMKSIRVDIETVAGSTLDSINTIKGMNSEIEEKVLTRFKDDLSLSNAIVDINKHEQMKAEILAKEEARRKQEEERRRLEEIERIKKEERQQIEREERVIRETLELARLEEQNRIKEAEQKARAAAIAETESKLMGIKEENIREVEENIREIEDNLEDAFIVEEELPFVMVGAFTESIKITATEEEFKQIEMYLNSIGVNYKRCS